MHGSYTPSTEEALLIVDDEDIVLMALKTQLKNEAFKVYTASSAKEALRILEEYPIQVLVTDLHMPGTELSGTEFLNMAQQQYPGVVRVVLSAQGTTTNILETLNAGHIYSFIKKPWDETELKRVLHQSFEIYHITHERDQLLMRAHNLNERLLEMHSSLERRFEVQSRYLEELQHLSLSLDKTPAELKRDLEAALDHIFRECEYALLFPSKEGSELVLSKGKLFKKIEISSAKIKKLFNEKSESGADWLSALGISICSEGEIKIFALRRGTDPSGVFLVQDCQNLLHEDSVKKMLPFISFVLQRCEFFK